MNSTYTIIVGIERMYYWGNPWHFFWSRCRFWLASLITLALYGKYYVLQEQLVYVYMQYAKQNEFLFADEKNVREVCKTINPVRQSSQIYYQYLLLQSKAESWISDVT